MDKDQLIESFFRSLRVALTNAFSYPKDHPYFIKSVESFKSELEVILTVLNPFKIGVTSSGIVVEATSLTKSGLYDELARLLHQRKIKTLEISSGSTLQEVIQFLSIISLPQKDIFKNGGLPALFRKEQLSHFTVQELDYSALLHGEGQECTDLWGYMLKEAIYSNDVMKFEQLANSFGLFIQRAHEKDLFDKDGIFEELNEFLISLRDKNKEKFDQCLKDIFLWLLRNKKTINQDNLAKFKPVFNDLDQAALAVIFKEGFTQEDDFDSLSLQLFSKISGPNNSPKIVEDFFSKSNEMQDLKKDPGMVKKIRNLLSSAKDNPMSAIYRSTLDSLIKNISFSGTLFFDHAALKENYRYIVLGILSTDENIDTLRMATALLEKELAGIFADNDVGFLKDLCDVLSKRNKMNADSCVGLERSLSAFIENIVLNGGLALEQEFLLAKVSFSSKEPDLYLDKIFTVEKVNKQVLGLFLRLFGSYLEAFYGRIKIRIQDTEFLASLIEKVSQVDVPETVKILEYIYSTANELIKVEVLKAMGRLNSKNTAFLIRQLNANVVLLKKEALFALVSDRPAFQEALDFLLKLPSPWGSKNKAIIENMQIVYELRIPDAVKLVKELSRRRFFWNRQLRNQASKILKEWNVS